MTFPPPKLPSDYAVALGERLRAARNRRGLSQMDVEKLSGRRWIAVCVGSYERGDRAITAEKLVALCAFYGADPGEVLTGVTPVTGPQFLRDWLSPLLELTDAELDDLIRRAPREGVTAA